MARLRDQRGAATFVGSYPGDLPDLGLPEIAFVGRSNVGKSSVLNALLHQGVARVSARPGRTQAINLFKIGTACVFADLPGYGFAKVPEAVRAAWRPMIDRYLSLRDALRLGCVLVDARIPAQETDRMMIAALLEMQIPTLVLANKIDAVNKAARKPTIERLTADHGLTPGVVLPFSAHSREGVDDAWATIEQVIASKP